MKISEATLAAEAKNTRVRTPRGSVSLTASKGMPPMRGDPLLKKGVADFEVCGERQKGDWSGFSQHSLGELLMGIAEGNGRLGNKEKATEYFGMIQQKLAGTAYAKKAEKWLAEGKLSARETNCLGCHIGSPKVQ